MSANFITLTYDTAHVPISKNGFMSCSKRDIQLFFKRLRKSTPNVKITYYACAEYGGKTFRPHYHIILFNSTLEDCECAWTLGLVHSGNVTPASIGYCLKYINKPSRIPTHRNDDRIPEFSLMSKGIGENYLTKAMCNWHLHPLSMEERMYCTVDGKKIAMPRYYKLKIYTQLDKLRIGAYVSKLPQPEITELQKLNRDLATIRSYEAKNKLTKSQKI